MKPTHTPGPWRISQHCGALGDTILAVISPNGNKICELFYFADVKRSQIEDARLISTSPELLTALVACVFALGHAGANQIGGPGRTEWEAARAAISKATGAP